MVAARASGANRALRMAVGGRSGWNTRADWCIIPPPQTGGLPPPRQTPLKGSAHVERSIRPVSEQKTTKTPASPGPDEDRLFAEPRERVDDFRFNAATAAVFDDMVSRSVPFYDEIQRIVVELAADFGVPGSRLYDMGCATGTTLAALDPLVDPEVNFVGIDNSDDMLGRAREKLGAVAGHRRLDLVNADLDRGVDVDDASVVVMILTLQFVRPLQRERLVRRVFAGMRKDAALILVEKITSPHTLLNRLFIKNYYEFKRRNGYSQVEIAQKREALENVLIPYRYEENVQMLHDVGFTQVDEVFRWYNFCCMVAVK
jgi:tRNA (cmo5U34)-methyltransferase